VLGYRSIPARVRLRIGRGNAAVAFMRLESAEDAKAASEQIGTDYRFVLSQLTETVGTSATETTGLSYTSTVGGSGSVATATSVSDSASPGTSESESITAGISASTAWGTSTSLATADSQSLAQSLQRSREFLVEQHELQRLPPTALIVSYATAAGRQVFMADANPAIGSLEAATMTPLAEAALDRGGVPAATADAVLTGVARPSWPGTAEPNLGPPSARLDWRKR
jgi:hypothetical protein